MQLEVNLNFWNLNKLKYNFMLILFPGKNLDGGSCHKRLSYLGRYLSCTNYAWKLLTVMKMVYLTKFCQI